TVFTSALSSATASGKKTGSVGAYFDGTGDYLTVLPRTDLVFGANSFSISCWVYLGAVGAAQTIISKANDGVTSFDFTFQITSSNFLRGDVRLGSTNFYSVASNLALSANTWYFIEMSVNRTSNTVDLFVGGVETTYSTQDSLSGSIGNNASLIKIGAHTVSSSAANLLTGYIDQLRISSGVIRNATNYTPPTTLYNGVSSDATVPTITFTGTATPALAADEDIEYTSVDNTTKADGSRSLTDTD
ncbi:uncharacterized protein METZ01_LOCUS476466, partial [marine metagenome]